MSPEPLVSPEPPVSQEAPTTIAEDDPEDDPEEDAVVPEAPEAPETAEEDAYDRVDDEAAGRRRTVVERVRGGALTGCPNRARSSSSARAPGPSTATTPARPSGWSSGVRTLHGPRYLRCRATFSP